MSMVDGEDRTAEGRKKFRYVHGRDPWDVARRNHWLTVALVFSVAINLAQSVALLMYLWARPAQVPRFAR